MERKAFVRFSALGVFLLAALAMGCDDSGRSPGVLTTDGSATEDGGPPTGDAVVHTDTGGGGGGKCTGGDADCAPNEYCDDSGLDPVCRDGCRPGAAESCDPGEACNPDSHVCEVVPCAGDDACADGEYCDAGVCKAGCRTDPDDCEPVNGMDRVCDPETHQCQGLVVCCGDADACDIVERSVCQGEVLENATSCDDNPCAAEACDPDAGEDTCEQGFYCTRDGRCGLGCKEGQTGECSSDQTCDPESHVCGPRDCAEHIDCPDFQACAADDLVCHDADCREDADCEAPARCDDNFQCNVFCEGDGDCGDNQWCDPALASCRDFCQAHDQCAPGEACAFDPGREDNICMADVCPDDLDDEPNDVADQATEIEIARDADGFGSGEIADRTLCPGNPDFYSVTLQQGERMRVEIVFDVAVGNLDMNLYDADGEVLEQRATAEATERIDFPPVGQVLNEATYYVEVLGSDDATQNQYTIRAQTVPAEDPCFRDPRDFGDASDNNPEEASRFAGARASFGVPPDFASICNGDQDWFAFPMDLNNGLEVELIGLRGSAPLAFDVYSQERINLGQLGNPNYTSGEAEAVGNGDAYRFSQAVDTGGFSDDLWFLRVRAQNDGEIGEYTLSIAVIAGGECPPDVAEGDAGNDDPANAYDLESLDPIVGDDGLLISGEEQCVDLALNICINDVDIFSLRAEDNDQLTARIDAPDAIGDLTVQFLDQDASPAGAAGAAGGDPATLNGVAAGRYYVRVDGLQAAQGDYTLCVTRAATMGCGADALEVGPGTSRDDTSGDARDLMSIDADGLRFEVNNGVICNNPAPDEDWYAFSVAEDRSRLSTVITFRGADGDLQLELYDAAPAEGEPCPDTAFCQREGGAGGLCVGGRCSAPLNAATSRYDGELINRTKGEVHAGDYLVRVFGRDNQEENNYNLTVTVVPETLECSPDWQEIDAPNDSPDDATFLGGGQHHLADVWICEDERRDGDWFDMVLQPGEMMTVAITYATFSDGRLLMTYLGPTADSPDLDAVVESLELQTTGQCMNFHGGEGGGVVHLNITPDIFIDDGDSRIDYVLRAVPTDLDANPIGQCENLFGGLFGDVDWPRVDLP